jgi:hypothetical protein
MEKPNGQNHAHLLSDKNGIIYYKSVILKQVKQAFCLHVLEFVYLTHLLKKTST